MKRFVFILFFLLNGLNLSAADDAKSEDGSANFEQQTLEALVNKQKELFELKVEPRVLNPQSTPIACKDVPTLHQSIMSFRGIKRNSDNGCGNRAHRIKNYLDQKKIWNQIVYIGNKDKADKVLSTFLLGPGSIWNHHWANLIAAEDRVTGELILLVIDPILFEDGPEPLDKWLQVMTADLYDGAQNYLPLGVDGELPILQEPTKEDLYMEISSGFYN